MNAQDHSIDFVNYSKGGRQYQAFCVYAQICDRQVLVQAWNDFARDSQYTSSWYARIGTSNEVKNYYLAGVEHTFTVTFGYNFDQEKTSIYLTFTREIDQEIITPKSEEHIVKAIQNALLFLEKDIRSRCARKKVHDLHLHMAQLKKEIVDLERQNNNLQKALADHRKNLEDQEIKPRRKNYLIHSIQEKETALSQNKDRIVALKMQVEEHQLVIDQAVSAFIQI